MAKGTSSTSAATTRVKKSRGRVQATRTNKAGSKAEKYSALKEAYLKEANTPDTKTFNHVYKRKRLESEDLEVEKTSPTNRVKKAKISPALPEKHQQKHQPKGRPAKPKESSHDSVSLPIINQVPNQPLAILIFGGGENGELGLGPKRTEASRPCLIPSLDPNSSAAYHVVEYACGGMHTVALSVDNKIITWGVNDDHALGRDTQWDGGLRDIDAGSDDDVGELNPLESTPTEIPAEYFPSGTRFAQVAAGNSCSFALTDTGLVYGWGAFRDSQGKNRFGYDTSGEPIEKQTRPLQIQGIPEITQIACGANHALALDSKGNIWAWGNNEQIQFGRRLFGRQGDPLIPHQVRVCRNNAKYIASGGYHSFTVDGDDNVWGWGANSFGQAGDPRTAGGDFAFLLRPVKIHDLCQKGVVALDGGAHHSAAITADGQCLVWGRIDAGQLGVAFTPDQVQDATLIRCDDRGKPRICLRPTAVPNIGETVQVACGTDHTIFIDRNGSAYSNWFRLPGPAWTRVH